MAADRFAGGRGAVFETHTAVSATPSVRTSNEYETRMRAMSHTRLPRRHEKKCNITTSNGHSIEADNVSQYGTPPPARDVEEAFTSSV